MQQHAMSLKTRSGRNKLRPAAKPYWTRLSRRCALGYKKNRHRGVWLLTLPHGNTQQRSREISLGEADDKSQPDGVAVLSFRQAVSMARQTYRKETAKKANKKYLYTVGDAAHDYITNYIRDGHYRIHDGRRVTTVNQHSVEFHIIPLLGHIPVARLTRADVQQWIQSFLEFRGRRQYHRYSGPAFYAHMPPTEEEMRQRQQTANRLLCLLKATLNYALREGHVTCDPSAWREIRYFRQVRVGPPKFMSLGEQRMLVAACEGDFRQLVIGALYTGARYAELAQLRAESFIGNAIQVPALITKTRKERRISLEKSARLFFASLVKRRLPEDLMFTFKGYPWRSDDQWRCMRAATLKAQLTDLKFRDLRNTAASNWVRAGVPLKYIADQLGNSIRICELHYTHVSPDHRSELFSKLPANCIDGLQDFPSDPTTLIRSKDQ